LAGFFLSNKVRWGCIKRIVTRLGL
jgi:hypothetical protein